LRYIEQNKKEFEICGILRWHEAGYTGKGIHMAEIEPARPDLWFFDGKLYDPFGNGMNAQYNCHGQKVLDVMHQVAPDAELYSLYSGIITKGNEVSGNFTEQTLPFAIENNIHIIGASLSGANHPVLNEKIKKAQEYGIIFTTSAGNKGEKGLDGFAESNVWIAIGATGYNDSRKEIYLKNYSSRGPELDIVGFSGLYVHDAKNPERVFQQEGTSFSQPFVAGMIALVQQFFLERAGRTLYQDEMQQFMQDHVIDLGEQGFDEEYGHGLFVLPEPESIDVNKYLIRSTGFQEISEPPKGCDNVKIVLQINNKTAYVDNKPVELDVAPKIENNRTLVPLRFVAENLGCKVEWNQNTKTITIIK
jgi:subtilisin family serine protease